MEIDNQIVLCNSLLRFNFYMQPGDLTTVIYDRGCLRSGEEWVERNLVPVAVFAVAIAVLQVNEKKIFLEIFL